MDVTEIRSCSLSYVEKMTAVLYLLICRSPMLVTGVVVQYTCTTYASQFVSSPRGQVIHIISSTFMKISKLKWKKNSVLINAREDIIC